VNRVFNYDLAAPIVALWALVGREREKELKSLTLNPLRRRTAVLKAQCTISPAHIDHPNIGSRTLIHNPNFNTKRETGHHVPECRIQSMKHLPRVICSRCIDIDQDTSNDDRRHFCFTSVGAQVPLFYARSSPFAV
jgi:hypothetical protein